MIIRDPGNFQMTKNLLLFIKTNTYICVYKRIYKWYQRNLLS